MDKIKTIKGTHDILPEFSHDWHNLEKIIHDNAKLFGYKEIRTPIIEQAKLFNRGIGEGTDIVSKEMYSWLDRDEKAIALRPEMTASVVRSFIQHNLGSQTPLQRLYYMGPSFRRERPQKGRQRQFHQFGVEAIGSNNPEQDAEVIILAWEILSKSGINNLELKLSSIGSDDCRNKYKNALIKFLEPHKNKLTDEEEINILKAAPLIGEFYTNQDREHFENLQKYLNAVSIPFTLDPLLVRGLDYYTQTTFEIISNDIGAQDALLGGGRYNGLIRSLGGKDTPAVGFAAGMERILLATNNNENSGRKIQTIYIVCVEEDVLNSVQKIARELRALNFMVLTETLRRSMKAQMREANKCNADLAIIIGEQEKNDKTVQVKNLNDGSQQTIEQKNIFEHFKSLTL